eukprot:5890508-Prymnesium_polylepis.1
MKYTATYLDAESKKLIAYLNPCGDSGYGPDMSEQTRWPKAALMRGTEKCPRRACSKSASLPVAWLEASPPSTR